MGGAPRRVRFRAGSPGSGRLARPWPSPTELPAIVACTIESALPVKASKATPPPSPKLIVLAVATKLRSVAPSPL